MQDAAGRGVRIEYEHHARAEKPALFVLVQCAG
jgi:hypothetical protein